MNRAIADAVANLAELHRMRAMLQSELSEVCDMVHKQERVLARLRAAESHAAARAAIDKLAIREAVAEHRERKAVERRDALHLVD